RLPTWLCTETSLASPRPSPAVERICTTGRRVAHQSSLETRPTRDAASLRRSVRALRGATPGLDVLESPDFSHGRRKSERCWHQRSRLRLRSLVPPRA